MKAMSLIFRSPRRAGLACVLAQALGACAPLPVAVPPAGSPPERFREVSRTVEPVAPELPDGAGWWTVFADPSLDALEQAALRGSPGLAQAAARVARAAAALGVSGAESRPTVGLSAGASRQIGPLVNAAGGQGNLFDLNAQLAWNLDLMQRLSRASQAAGHDLRQQQALQRQARLVLEAEVAQSYLQWRAAGIEHDLAERTLQADRELLAMAERRVAAGLAPRSAVSAARAQMLADEAERHALDRRQRLLENAMAALAGPPSTLPALPVIPAGLPSQMLLRRADVAAAESALQASALRLGVARDAWFPSLTLTASAGLASSELGQWLRASARNTGLGLLLSLPGLDGGRGDAQRAMAAAQLDLAAAEHREVVVNALRDVEDQLATLRTLGAESAARTLAAQDAERDAVHHHTQWRQGLGSEADAVQARRQQLQQARQALRAQAAERVATVALVRALGGGWAGDAVPSRGR
jgi:outer membrane protein, multidrug efflux system